MKKYKSKRVATKTRSKAPTESEYVSLKLGAELAGAMAKDREALEKQHRMKISKSEHIRMILRKHYVLGK